MTVFSLPLHFSPIFGIWDGWKPLTVTMSPSSPYPHWCQSSTYNQFDPFSLKADIYSSTVRHFNLLFSLYQVKKLLLPHTPPFTSLMFPMFCMPTTLFTFEETWLIWKQWKTSLDNLKYNKQQVITPNFRYTLCETLNVAKSWHLSNLSSDRMNHSQNNS